MKLHHSVSAARAQDKRRRDDCYDNYDQLHQRELVGTDYRIIVRHRHPTTVIIAPHDGLIEENTGSIARRIADQKYSLYRFIGQHGRWVKGEYRYLHITSANFNEPLAVELVRRHRWVVAIHGASGPGRRVLLGGKDRTLVGHIQRELAREGITGETTGHKFTGLEPTSICNRGEDMKGAQIELTRRFRQHPASVAKLIRAVRRALHACA